MFPVFFFKPVSNLIQKSHQMKIHTGLPVHFEKGAQQLRKSSLVIKDSFSREMTQRQRPPQKKRAL